MSSKPVGFQDITSNVLGYTINTSTPQCRWVADQIADLPQATQDEIYGRFYAVNNHLEKDAAKGRKYLYTSLDYSGLSQQLGKVATDITKCIKMLQLMAQKAPWHSIYHDLSAFAHLDINTLGGATQTGIAAYVEKYDPLPPATPVNTAPANAASPASSENNIDEERMAKLYEAALPFATLFLEDYKTLREHACFFIAKEQHYSKDQVKVLEIYDSLSPCARLLIEQGYIRDTLVLPDEKTEADTMRATIAGAHPGFIKKDMWRLLTGFDGDVAGLSITDGMKLEHLGKMEQLFLKMYLGLPRHSAFAFLKAKIDDTPEALEQFMYNGEVSLPPQMIMEFNNLAIENALLQGEAQRLYNSLPPEEADNSSKKLLIAHGFFTKKDWL